MNMFTFVSMLLRGFGQIFFMDGIWTGALIAIAIGIASPIALILALIGGAVSALVDYALGYDPALYASGVAAYTGILIGCATAFYVKSLPTSVLVTIVASAVGGIVFYLLVKNNITPYALPFTLIAFIIAASVRTYGL